MKVTEYALFGIMLIELKTFGDQGGLPREA